VEEREVGYFRVHDVENLSLIAYLLAQTGREDLQEMLEGFLVVDDLFFRKVLELLDHPLPQLRLNFLQVEVSLNGLYFYLQNVQSGVDRHKVVGQTGQEVGEHGDSDQDEQRDHHNFLVVRIGHQVAKPFV